MPVSASGDRLTRSSMATRTSSSQSISSATNGHEAGLLGVGRRRLAARRAISCALSGSPR